MKFKLINTIGVSAAVLAMTACTTMPDTNIVEAKEADVKRCTELGSINGNDSIFVGLSSSVGTKNAKARAMNEAVAMKATHVVWSQMGTSMTNEWVGKGYRCK